MKGPNDPQPGQDPVNPPIDTKLVHRAAKKACENLKKSVHRHIRQVVKPQVESMIVRHFDETGGYYLANFEFDFKVTAKPVMAGRMVKRE